MNRSKLRIPAWALALALVAQLGAPAAARPVERPAAAPAMMALAPKVERPYREGQILVRYKRGVTVQQQAHLRSSLGLQRVRQIGRTGVELLAVGPGRTTAEAVAALRRSDAVELVQPNYRYQSFDLDPDYPLLWGLNNQGQEVQGLAGAPDVDIDAPEAEPLISNLRPTVVAVLDTGVLIDHPELQGQLWTNPGEIPGDGIDNDGNGYIDDIHGWDFCNQDNTLYDGPGDYHGTHVAGTLAATAKNGLGIAGVAPNVQIMVLKFLGHATGDYYCGWTSDAIAAIEYYTHFGVKLSNNSWGAVAGHPDDLLLQEAIEASGSLFVAAAGNHGVDTDLYGVVPVGLHSSKILGVAALEPDGELAAYSNYGASSVHVGAPGTSIWSTYVPLTAEGMAVQVNRPEYSALLHGFSLADIEPEQRADLLDRSLAALGLTKGSTLLLVQDDESVSDPDYYPDFSEFYLDALDEAGYTEYTLYQVPQGAEGPDLTTLSAHDGVIWFTGWSFGEFDDQVLHEADMANLTAYLQGGKALWLSGEDALYNLEIAPFVMEQLGARVIGEDGRYLTLTGSAGSAYEGISYAFTESNEYRDLLQLADPLDPTTRLALVTTSSAEPQFSYLSGTSMAAPHVTGIAAAIAGQKNLSPEEIKELILQGSRPLASLEGLTVTGGLVNLYNVLATAPVLQAVTASPNFAGQVAAYTLAGQTGRWGALAPGNSITITLPEGSLPASIPADQLLVNGTAVGTAASLLLPNGNSLQFPSPIAIPGDGELSISLLAGAGIRNPAAGAHSLSLATEADPTSASQPIQIADPPQPPPPPAPPPDRTPPGAPQVNPVTDQDTRITGTAEPYSRVSVAELGEGWAGADGAFTISIKPQPAGAQLSLTARDSAGNLSAPTIVTVLDRTAPAAPLLEPIDSAALSLTGSAEAGATVTLTVGPRVIGTGTAGTDGRFSISIAPLPAQTLVIGTATDGAGNRSPGARLTVTAAPAPPPAPEPEPEPEPVPPFTIPLIPALIPPAPPPQRFDDLPVDHWAHEAVSLLRVRGIINGMSETEFQPDSPVTRAQFAAMLARALKLAQGHGGPPPFEDVQATDWYFNAVQTAAAAGLITGSDGAFRPNDPISRQEMAVMLTRALGLRGKLLLLPQVERQPFADFEQVAPWARAAVAQAVAQGLITGRPGRIFDGEASTTRAEAAVVLHRLLKALGEV